MGKTVSHSPDRESLASFRTFIVQVHRTVITRGLQIGPMRKHALNFLRYILYCLCKLTHPFLSILTSFAILLQWFLLYHFWMNYFLVPMALRCHAPSFPIPYLFTTESPTPFSFFLNKPLSCLLFTYPNFERYLFRAESSLTLDLWNKAIFLSKKIMVLTLILINAPNACSLPRAMFYRPRFKSQHKWLVCVEHRGRKPCCREVNNKNWDKRACIFSLKIASNTLRTTDVITLRSCLLCLELAGLYAVIEPRFDISHYHK